jgi:hypothetical protein
MNQLAGSGSQRVTGSNVNEVVQHQKAIAIISVALFGCEYHRGSVSAIIGKFTHSVFGSKFRANC